MWFFILKYRFLALFSSIFKYMIMNIDIHINRIFRFTNEYMFK
jgi:hypothetical protein